MQENCQQIITAQNPRKEKPSVRQGAFLSGGFLHGGRAYARPPSFTRHKSNLYFHITGLQTRFIISHHVHAFVYHDKGMGVIFMDYIFQLAQFVFGYEHE